MDLLKVVDWAWQQQFKLYAIIFDRIGLVQWAMSCYFVATHDPRDLPENILLMLRVQLVIIVLGLLL